ncbi:hypothetical protein ACVC7V_18665 [Hydrogenophaga sp. A37]|uniref:hypothetical protein n=1 Tax=Hydrogenophaga sp. A37 TaxID=1945864 RepID=UPI000984DD1B|nr:hypothetical protein [Hydrogenophaga sp. A37]OOG82760.1 hypothetical protein B0E41_14110 [Hydrogenophaga sp. A37]
MVHKEGVKMNYETPELFLEKLALRGGTHTYTEFAQYFGWDVPKPSQWKSSKIGMRIAEITEEDARFGRPFRSAVLVRVKEQTPGRGFFATYNRTRAVDVISEEERDEAWKEERRRAATYPWWTVSGLNVERF